jgi:hypothetical protein
MWKETGCFELAEAEHLDRTRDGLKNGYPNCNRACKA